MTSSPSLRLCVCGSREIWPVLYIAIPKKCVYGRSDGFGPASPSACLFTDSSSLTRMYFKKIQRASLRMNS